MLDISTFKAFIAHISVILMRQQLHGNSKNPTSIEHIETEF